MAQDTLSRVVERWDRIRSLDDPEGYTFRIAFNLANSWWRRRRAEFRAMGNTRSIVPAASTVDDSDPRPERLRVALMTLSGRQREVIVYRFFLDRSVRETAVAMKCADGTVRALTAQALAALRSSGIEVDDG